MDRCDDNGREVKVKSNLFDEIFCISACGITEDERTLSRLRDYPIPESVPGSATQLEGCISRAMV